MSGKTPTERCLIEGRKRGWWVTVVERWVRNKNIRQDAFGFGDILVMDGQPGALLIQACITSDMSTRIKKIVLQRTTIATAWLEAGNRIEVWGWALRGKAGARKLWTLKVHRVLLETLQEVAA